MSNDKQNEVNEENKVQESVDLKKTKKKFFDYKSKIFISVFLIGFALDFTQYEEIIFISYILEFIAISVMFYYGYKEIQSKEYKVVKKGALLFWNLIIAIFLVELAINMANRTYIAIEAKNRVLTCESPKEKQSLEEAMKNVVVDSVIFEQYKKGYFSDVISPSPKIEKLFSYGIIEVVEELEAEQNPEYENFISIANNIIDNNRDYVKNMKVTLSNVEKIALKDERNRAEIECRAVVRTEGLPEQAVNYIFDYNTTFDKTTLDMETNIIYSEGQ